MTYRPGEWLDPRIGLRPSPIQGTGMYALEPIQAGEVVVIWGGEVFTGADIAAGMVAPGSTVSIGEDVYLGSPAGAYDRERDDRGDFINHSCDPNVWMADEVTQVARRDIAASAELTMDYAMIEADEQDAKPWTCRCGAPTCRGRVTGLDWQLDALQQAYAGHFSPFINRRIEAHRLGVRVRKARAEDAAAIAEVQIRGWQWAYPGQIPDDYLHSLTEKLDERTRNWERTLTSRPQQRVWVTESAGQAVGFAATMRSRDDDAGERTGEVGAIYLDTGWAGWGMGRILFDQAVDDLRLLGYETATLWVLESNARARRFYAAAGFHADGASKTGQWPGFSLEEIRYRRDLR